MFRLRALKSTPIRRKADIASFGLYVRSWPYLSTGRSTCYIGRCLQLCFTSANLRRGSQLDPSHTVLKWVKIHILASQKSEAGYLRSAHRERFSPLCYGCLLDTLLWLLDDKKVLRVNICGRSSTTGKFANIIA